MKRKAITDNGVPLTIFFLVFLLLNLPACGGGGGGSGGSSKESDQPPTTPIIQSIFLNDYFLTVDLSWSLSVDDIGVSGYKVYRNGTFLSYADSNEFTDTDLKLDTRYCYTVKAYDGAGNDSSPSNQVCIQTSTTLVSPVIALRAVAVSSTQIKLSWVLSPANLVISGYNVYRTGTRITSAYSTSFSDKELGINTEHCYTVTASDPRGRESAPSDQACATTGQGGDVNVLGLWNGNLSGCFKPDNFTLSFYGDFQVNGSIGECIRDFIPLSGNYTINGNVVTFDLVSSTPDTCKGTIKGTGTVNNNVISGTVSGAECLYSIGSAFNLRKIL
jgi:chitodextrinase